VLERISSDQRIGVGEEFGPLGVGAWWIYGLALVAGIACTGWLWAVWRRDRDRARRLIVLVFACGLGLTEQRHLRVFSPVILIGVGVLIWEWARRVRRGYWVLGTAPVIALLLLSQYSIPGRLANNQAAARRYAVVKSVSDWFLHNTESVDRDRPDYGIAAPWAIGHHISVLGKRPVALDPFNFPVPIEEKARRLWWSKTEDELVSAMQADRLRYLCLYRASGEILGLSPDYPSRYLKLAPGTRRGYAYGLEMNVFAAHRLAIGQGLDGEFGHLRLRYLSYAVGGMELEYPGHTSRWVEIPEMMVFEAVEGARIRGRADPGTTLLLSNRLQTIHGRSHHIEMTISVGADGIFDQRVALPAPVRESIFMIAEPYRLRMGDREVFLGITDEDVRLGRVIEVDLGP